MNNKLLKHTVLSLGNGNVYKKQRYRSRIIEENVDRARSNLSEMWTSQIGSPSQKSQEKQ